MGHPDEIRKNMALGVIGVMKLSLNFAPVIGAYVIVGRSVYLPDVPSDRKSPWAALFEETVPPKLTDPSRV